MSRNLNQLILRDGLPLLLLAACLAVGGRQLRAGGTDEPKPNVIAPTNGAADQPNRREELRYGGKDFQYWRRQLVIELKPECRIEALRAMATFGARGFGSEATAAILDSIRGYTVESYRVENLWTVLRPKGSDEDETKVIDAANAAVIKIGDSALVVVITSLEDKNASMRCVAAYLLPKLPATNDERIWKAARPILLRALKHADPDVREAAVSRLDGLGLPPEQLTSILVATLKEKGQDERVRLEALEQIRVLGPKARTAEPLLLEIIQIKDDMQRNAALAALNTIGADPKRAIPVVIMCASADSKLFDEKIADSIGSDPRLLVAATNPSESELHLLEASIVAELEAIKAFGAGGRPAVTDLLLMLKSRSVEVRTAAAETLGAIGPEAKAAIPALTDLLRIKATNLQNASSKALSLIDSRKYRYKEKTYQYPIENLELPPGSGNWTRVIRAD